MMDSISKLEMLSENITEMINEVGKTVLGTNGEYDKILIDQSIKLIGFYTERIIGEIEFKNWNDKEFWVIKENKLPLISKVLFEDFINNQQIPELLLKNHDNSKEVSKTMNTLLKSLGQHLMEIYPRLELKSFNKNLFEIYLSEIKPMLDKYPNLKEEFIKQLSIHLIKKLPVTPF